MNINDMLRKEGINVVRQFSTLEVNLVANTIATKLCKAFPEHGFNQPQLFTNISRLNMYYAKMPNTLSCAKYVAENNSIYVNVNASLDNIDDLFIHECLHFLQEVRDSYGKLTKLGLATFSKKVSGIALNEAAVQLMAAEANENKEDYVTYFNIQLSTTTPLYYTLECALLSQMVYFTGTYPLYNSTINGNSLFENTFVAKAGKSTFNTIRNNLDKLVNLEDVLGALTYDLKTANDNTKKIAQINKAITSKKREIFLLFLKTQNLIMTSCFDFEFKHIRTKEELLNFRERLYNYQNLIGTNKDYTFYNDFYTYTMSKFDEKYDYFETHSYIPTGAVHETALALLEPKTSIFEFIKIFLSKFKKLNGIRQESIKVKGKI